MINWKDHKAALTGASKYLIKGVFQFVHSVTSEAPDTPDCVTPLIGKIDVDPTLLTGLIDPGVTALTSTIQPVLAVEGNIIDVLALLGAIDGNPTLLTGIIDSEVTALTGIIQDVLALEGNLCID